LTWHKFATNVAITLQFFNAANWPDSFRRNHSHGAMAFRSPLRDLP